MGLFSDGGTGRTWFGSGGGRHNPRTLKSIGGKAIDILKLDVEGAERELFNRGAEDWLGAVGQMIIELHDRFVPGCAYAFYSAIGRYPFVQEIEGKNIFINFQEIDMNPTSADQMHD